MPRLPEPILFQKLLAAMPVGTEFESEIDSVRPAILRIPSFGRARVYLWTCTEDRSSTGSRPPDEFKIQIILPEQPRQSTASLVLDNVPTFLLGFSPNYGVFSAWDARQYATFRYSRNVQTKEHLLIEARDTGWAVAPPNPRKNNEVRVTCSPGNLFAFFKAARHADRQAIEGQWREAYFLSVAPNLLRLDHQPQIRNADKAVEFARKRVSQSRLARDPRFAPLVKREFNQSCAVCKMQLEIVEAAHVIPVNEPKSRDELWNGLALCPNHHKLFDNRMFVIRSDLRIKVDLETLHFLESDDLDEGSELLTEFDGQLVIEPNYFQRDLVTRNKLCEALEHRAVLAGVS